MSGNGLKDLLPKGSRVHRSSKLRYGNAFEANTYTAIQLLYGLQQLTLLQPPISNMALVSYTTKRPQYDFDAHTHTYIYIHMYIYNTYIYILYTYIYVFANTSIYTYIIYIHRCTLIHLFVHYFFTHMRHLSVQCQKHMPVAP